ncbi:MAG: electron transport complex subunit RsxG [gamma proteobacterium symbiont of Bathyaustriella thionipta]|nr:electron transport complex subunit RsxG [gamma proteobacterium symbiont of Bathyaustriella thionipta]
MIKHPVTLAALVLALFGLAGSALVAVVHHVTEDKIAANERAILLQQLDAIIPADALDNNFLADTLTISEPDFLGAEETTVYLGFKNKQPVAMFFSPVNAPGYAGPIKLLIAVYYDGTLGGVRVLSHRETPGLGDKIDLSRTQWIHSFDRRSLANLPLQKWKVKKHGGVFDQFSGATITPAAVVDVTKKTLLYYKRSGQGLFARFQQQSAMDDAEESADESE